MLNIKVVMADGVLVEMEVEGDHAGEVIEAVEKLNKELGMKKTEMRFNVCKAGRWVEAEG